MNELNISHQDSKFSRLYRWIAGAFFICVYLYLMIFEAMSNQYGTKFYIYLIGFLLGLGLILQNVLKGPDILKIDNSEINMNYGKQKFMIEWTSVSQVNVGINYIVFALNGGQKQQKIDLSYFTYVDLKNIKSKILELCEQKSISYKND